MKTNPDATAILYEFSLDLETRKFDRNVLDEWSSRYPSLAQDLIDFYVDEVRTEELCEREHLVIDSLEGVKASGLSKLRGILIGRNNGASKRGRA